MNIGPKILWQEPLALEEAGKLTSPDFFKPGDAIAVMKQLGKDKSRKGLFGELMRTRKLINSKGFRRKVSKA